MKTIEDGSGLIADFMKLSKQDKSTGGNIFLYESPTTGEYIDADDLEYISSWDMLMPAIQKCYDLISPILDGMNGNDENLIGDISTELLDGRIAECYEAVVKAIEFYNDNKITFRPSYQTSENCNCAYSHDTTYQLDDSEIFDNIEDAIKCAENLTEDVKNCRHSHTTSETMTIERYINDEFDDEFKSIYIWIRTIKWDYEKEQEIEEIEFYDNKKK